LPTDKPVFVLGDYPDMAGANKVAELVKARGVEQVYLIDGNVDLMKEAGFFYYHDEEVENARIAKEKAEALAKQQAAAQKK
jgi:calcineurin-like phosphoesterase family protein